ncbi:glycoside hydrolase family 27 protein, partial [Frankia sp. AiPs1]|uniref:glycoside hydrolase family 27 protein n=1 Tax=Frankia sp. AiPs1 TaxID=573493 RepID=UPI0020437535
AGARGSLILLLLVGLLLVGLAGDGGGVPLVVDTAANRQVSAGLARTPPMGWNSWNAFGGSVRDSDIRAAADALVRSGMRAAGYRYVIVDDGWMAPTRGDDGRLVADPERFPAGIAALAAYVHARGLRFGLYASPGRTTCQGLPGSFGHETTDAATLAGWGVDYLKYDACGYPDLRPAGADARRWLIAGFGRMRAALDATGRPVVFSINPSSDGDPTAGRAWTWAPRVAHLWRVTNDHAPCWASTQPMDGYPGVCTTDNLAAARAWASAGGPGHWNDLDMLAIGLTPATVNPVVRELAGLATATAAAALDDTEARGEMSIWSMFASPLLAGNDLARMTAETAAILTNAAVLAVDQDPLGAAPVAVPRSDGLLLWTRPLAGGDTAVLAVNRSDSPRATTLTGTELTLPATAAGYRATDLWAGTSTTSADGSLPITLAPRSAALFRLAPADRDTRRVPFAQN